MLETSEERCRRYRLRILEMSQKVTALHVAPAFSCIEIVDALYNEIMETGDIFIMSKGHGCLSQYVVLEDLGMLDPLDLPLYCKPEGVLGAHPDYDTNRGIHASTGSLGHGLGIAVGQAYAGRLKDGDEAATVYCLLSDGECQEGSTWEAVMMAANLGLTNLVGLVDNNDFGGLARISEEHPALYPLAGKFLSFGWNVASVVEGNDSSAVLEALRTSGGPRPDMIICKTIKGKGVSYMEDEPIWHYRSPNAEEYAKAVEELTVG